MWWRLARKTMCLLATGYTNCLSHAVLLSKSKPLTLKTVQWIWNILPHSKVEKSTTNTIRNWGHIKCQNKTSRWNKNNIDFPVYPVDVNHTFRFKENFKSSSDFEAKSSSVTTPLQRFKVGWTSVFTWRLAIHFKDIILATWASVRPSKIRVPFLCLVTDWTSAICCWRSRAKRQKFYLPLYMT